MEKKKCQNIACYAIANFPTKLLQKFVVFDAMRNLVQAEQQ